MNTSTRLDTIVLTLALVLCLAGASALKGQDAGTPTPSVVPPLIKFNGVIPSPTTQNRPGDSASVGQVTTTFSLYQFQEGGTPLWSETQKVQLDEQGRYVVLLGATSSAGLPLDLFTSGKALWLGVQPQLSGAGELPRVLLVAVPYALKSSDSDTLGGKPASAYALAGAPTVVGLSGVATSTSPAQPGSKVGEAAGKSAPELPLAACTAVTSDGTAAAGEIAKFTTACNIEKSLLRDTGTAVAVGGTATPAALFDVQFTSTATGGKIFGQRAFTTVDPAANSAASTSAFFSNAETRSGNTKTFTANLYGLNSEVDHYGKGSMGFAYGVNGTVFNRSTGTIAHAYGISTGLTNIAKGTITDGYGVYVNAPANSGGGTFTNYTGLYIANPTAVASAYGLYSAGGKNYFAGDVGIATTTPGANLEVNGTTKFDGLVIFAAAQTFTGNGAGLTNVNASLLGGLTATAFQPAGAYATLGANTFTATQMIKGIVQVDSAGVNSGHSTPGIVFGAGAASETISSNRTGSVNHHGLDFYTGNTVRMSVSNSGLVGIGTQAPTAALNVVSNTLGDDGIDVSGDSAPSGSDGAGSDGIYALGGGSDPDTTTTAIGGAGITAIGGNSANGIAGPGVSASGGFGPGTGDGIDAYAGGGWAGYFTGTVEVDGELDKNSGAFKIDHPLDPANKYLYHSFVESPDMKNIYDGVVTLDGRGEAEVELPEWFQTLNSDFRYQLTCIGGYAPVYIAAEVAGNRFKIAGGRAGLKISWQVTGIRQDAWANAHRITTEVNKPRAERGYYLHPELYGAPEEKGVQWARHPETMQRLKKMREKATQATAK